MLDKFRVWAFDHAWFVSIGSVVLGFAFLGLLLVLGPGFLLGFIILLAIGAISYAVHTVITDGEPNTAETRARREELGRKIRSRIEDIKELQRMEREGEKFPPVGPSGASDVYHTPETPEERARRMP